MKTIICLLTLISSTTFAQGYKAPEVQKLHWEKTEQKTQQNNQWISDYQLKEQQKLDPADNPERKPSSGDESKKPKFWDFQVVK